MKQSTFIAMIDAIHGELLCEAEDRSRPDWIERERRAVTNEANRWATSHNLHTVTVDDVERVEPRAMGHVDYSRKLALYVAELVRGTLL